MFYFIKFKMVCIKTLLDCSKLLLNLNLTLLDTRFNFACDEILISLLYKVFYSKMLDINSYVIDTSCYGFR